LLNAFTHADADPVASKVANRCATAPRTAVTGAGDDVAGGVAGQPGGQRGDQFPAAGLGQDAAAQPGPDEVQLGFLCGPGRYADPGGGAGGGEAPEAHKVGIISVMICS
jgi:hypothetical protein